MKTVLEHVGDAPVVEVAAGETFLNEGETSGKLYVLAEGVIEVYRDDVEIAVVSARGAVFGEMSILLGAPHTASVRAREASRLHVIDDAIAYLADNPSVTVPVARLLAQRLQNATSYLVDLKHQFRHHDDHLSMVDEVLESLIHGQGDSSPPTPSGGQ